jgi:hypothetical protein
MPRATQIEIGVPAGYSELVAELKTRIRSAQGACRLRRQPRTQGYVICAYSQVLLIREVAGPQIECSVTSANIRLAA